jgi:hypothetical protein
MQHIQTIEILKRAVRSRVCTVCFKRPPGSETLDAETPRSCEPQCAIFMHLPVMRRIVQEQSDRSIAPYEDAMRELVCQHCQLTPTAGDYCAERANMRCPLAHYAVEVVDALESVLKHGY